eukprot:359159-Chlamydomonas_euryale.AAC.33
MRPLTLPHVPRVAKLVLISNNCPPVRKSEIEYYAMLAKAGVHHYAGSEFLLSGMGITGMRYIGMGHASACCAWHGMWHATWDIAWWRLNADAAACLACPP